MSNLDENILKQNPYFLFYEMMVYALKTDDVVDGMNKSLYLLKLCIKCGDIVLHKKENGMYIHSISQTGMQHQIPPISCIVNKTAPLIESKDTFNLELGLSDNFKNMMFVHMNTDDSEYILSINNVDYSKITTLDFFNKLQETMLIILKRAEMYEKNTKAINTDLLTGLDNRNSYETRLQNLDKEKSDLVYGIFDLFRLKYINDNYTHVIGDKYICEVANILNKYWPKEKIEIVDNSFKKSTETGHCIYRVGGDEFVLLTSKEKADLVSIKAKLACSEIEMIDLGLEDKPLIGLNYGITSHKPKDSIKDTYKRADQLMSEDKSRMYLKYNIERRRS